MYSYEDKTENQGRNQKEGKVINIYDSKKQDWKHFSFTMLGKANWINLKESCGTLKILNYLNEARTKKVKGSQMNTKKAKKKKIKGT